MENVLKIHISRRAKKITMRTVTYVGCIVLAIFFIFPLLWMIVTSTKTEMQYANDLGSFATFLPNVSDLSTFFDNYLSVLTEYDIWKYALNSLGYAAAVVVWAFFFDFLPLAKVAVEAPDRSSSESRQIRYRFIM